MELDSTYRSMSNSSVVAVTNDGKFDPTGVGNVTITGKSTPVIVIFRSSFAEHLL